MMFNKHHFQKVTDHWLTVDIIFKLRCKALVISTHEHGTARVSLFSMRRIYSLLAVAAAGFLICLSCSVL